MDSISAARWRLDGGYPGYAASRADFAMFDIAEAFLAGEGMAFSSRSAVIASFGRCFIKTGRVPTEFHRFLIEGQHWRHSGDYGHRNVVGKDEAKEQITRAIAFLTLAQQLIGPLPPSDDA